MKHILFLFLIVLAVACGGGGGSSNGGPGAARALPVLTLSSEETINEDDARLKTLCSSTQNRIDPRINKDIAYSGIVEANFGTRDVSASGTGTWDNYVIEKTENTLKFKTSTKMTMTASNGNTSSGDNDVVFTIECIGNPKSCQIQSNSKQGSSSFPGELAKNTSVKRLALGKAKVDGKEYQALRKVVAGKFPVQADGRTLYTGVEAEFITIPALPNLGVSYAPGDDCGSLAFMRITVYQPDAHIKMEMTMLLLKVEGQPTNVPAVP